jgi:hypothetical protein
MLLLLILLLGCTDEVAPLGDCNDEVDDVDEDNEGAGSVLVSGLDASTSDAVARVRRKKAVSMTPCRRFMIAFAWSSFKPRWFTKQFCVRSQKSLPLSPLLAVTILLGKPSDSIQCDTWSAVQERINAFVGTVYLWVCMCVCVQV